MNSGQRKILSSQASALIHFGYIVVPKDVDRDTFIEQCYRWERVSVLGERGSLWNDCYISRSALREVEFPAKYDKLGSCVSYFNDPYSGLPIVLEVFSKEDESQLLKEGVFKIVKVTDSCSVTVTGDSKRGVLNLSVKGGECNRVNLVVSGSEDGELNLRSSGNVNIYTAGNVSIKSEGDILLDMDNKLKVRGGSQAMVKGGELKTQLNQNNSYLTTLSNAIESALSTVGGGYVTAAALVAFQTAMAAATKGDWSDIESKESYIDK